ncbi:heat shock 70 kDa protein 12A-like [Saccostrea echinata]|uniref:heat shock 70 kDa protein 12A-like n=1 Tax=Saccostrea echinata TaxID=191078 RepID=UPI002A7F38AF|nr:heat shock 70 kDa protein 12A-like [Saccostrea echinata]
MASGLEEKVPISGLEERVPRKAVHGRIEEDKKDSQRDSRIVIAAIDFGTTYSGYAYAFKDELDKTKSTKEMCNVLSKTWQSGSDAGLISHKTPTCLLLNPEGNFDSFGFQAEEKYNNLTNDNAHDGWRFFRRFKMILLNEKHLNKDTVISDDQNQNLEAVTVFAHSIKYIKNELWKQLSKTGYSIEEKEIQWVLTIPAIWNPRSKQFMRFAAEQAGIPGNQLEFALEPEAAAVYVKETKVAKESLSADEHQLVPFKPGTQFMVLDLGGRSGKIIIAAIDFGTTYSGYAYTFKSDLEESKSAQEMCKVLTHNWQSGSGAGLISHKTPTSLLLTQDEEFDSFGYKAEEKYVQLANENKHTGWRFFRKFKMILHKNDVLTKNTTINDDQGNPVLAVDVFAHSIRFMKKELLNELEKAGIDVKENEILWVLTIPAIWDPKSKEFMRVAAHEAGIASNQLEFALEPEAASVYVKEMTVSKKETSGEKELVPFHPGTQYMVLDLGGGTIDIVVKEVREDRTLRELHYACGNGLGGESVNIRIASYFEEVFGKDVMKKFRTNNEYKASWLDLETEIEQKKRTLQFDLKGRLKMSIPPVLLEIFESLRKLNPREHFNSIEHLTLSRDKLYINKDLIYQLFQPSVESILNIMKEILDKPHLYRISDVIMVGGFSQCPLISEQIKSTFRDLKVVVPNDADLAVLKGAVIYRHWPEVIYSRRAPFSLGARFARCWLDGDDIQKQFKNRKGEKMCGDWFCKFVTKNEEFNTTDKAILPVSPMEANTKFVPVEIFKSDEEEPRYTTDPSSKSMGKAFNVDMSDLTGGLDREAHVTLTMGSTEIKVEGQQIPNGVVKNIKLDLLND